MNKRILTTAIAALTIGWVGVAGATQSRIQAMGGGIKQLTVLDDTNIFFLPAELVKYGTWAAIEIGAADVTAGRATPGTSFQIHYNFSPTAVLAVYGTNQSPQAITLGQQVTGRFGSQYGDLNGPGLLQGGCAFCNQGDAGGTAKGTILFGLDLPQSGARIGFMLSAFADSTKTFDNAGAVTESQGPLVIDFGFGAGFAAGAGDIDLGLKVGFATPTHEDAAGSLSDSTQIDVGLVFRGTFPFSGPHEIVPFAVIDLAFGNSALATQGSDTFNGFLFDFTAGVDVRLNLGDGITVQPGIGFSGGMYNRTQNVNATGAINNRGQHQFTFPFYNLAVDVQVTDWFDIRFGGAQRVFWVWDSGDDDGNSIGTSSEAKVEHMLSTGVGFNLPAGVAIDIEVNTGWWQKGPFLLTGEGGGFGVNAAISKDW